MIQEEKTILINIEDQVKLSYIDYSMSVIVSRALPDVRDGLKPVHRRVLYGMYMLGIFSNRSYKKSARIVGEVLGKYHPHGDKSVYDTIVRMAQNWSMRYKLIDGQGNFGSLDNDPPAAMRYTEIRLKDISEEMLVDIDKNTVEMKYNFDETLKEPTVLPTKMPNLLINGSSGIAVGMATNMPPHNLKEVIDAICQYIDNPNISIKEISNYIIAPDFPTGGIIYGYQGVKDYFYTGKGKLILRAKVHFEEINNRQCIIVDEIPYQVNKEEMIKKTINLIKEDKIKGIHNIRDESGRQGMRIVYFLKNEKNNNLYNIILNKLYKYTQLQISFNVNNIALVNGLPVQLNIKDIIKYFVNHRHDIVTKRIRFELNKSQNRLHILKGFLIILKNIDFSIELIKKSNNIESAKLILIKNFNLTPIQANSALDIKLQRLTNIEHKKILEEYNYLDKEILKLKNYLENKYMRMQIIKNELIDISNKYGDKRITEIDYSNNEFIIEDLIPNEQVILTISYAGYIKRTPLSEYKRQARGGIGNRAVITRDNDFLEHLFVGKNHQYLLFFTEKGKCFWIRVFELPEGSKLSKGRAIQNLINLDYNDKVRAYILVKNLNDTNYINNHYVIMITKNGIIKRTLLSNYSKPRKNGIKATIIKEEDRLIEVKLTKGNSDILVAIKSGKAIRFSENKVRSMGRISAGVNAIKLSNKEDFVIGMICINSENNNKTILVVSEKGFGKRSKLSEYRLTNRGGKGIKTINITKKTGNLISIKSVTDNDDLLIINKSGLLIRMSITGIRTMGRARQGVKLINIKEYDQIASVANVAKVSYENL